MPKTAEKIEQQSFDKPAEVRECDKCRVEVVKVGGAVIGRATFEPGWQWSKSLKPIVKTGSCESEHLLFQVSGTMRVRMDDGVEFTSEAGDVVKIPAGHDAWVEGTEKVVVVDFEGMKDYAKDAEGGRGDRVK
ncbi:MAG: cupin domain-containing protein [Elusimicrobiota bacterium]|jgi:mannose-6-phosphate isomerase-like protein (cupin superfamily)